MSDNLLHVPSEDIKDFLVNLTEVQDLLLENGFDLLLEDSSNLDLEHESLDNIRLRFADNFNVGREPARPIKCITLFDFSLGGPDLHITRDGELDYLGVQIRVRDKYREAFRISDGLMRHLHGKANLVINNTCYLSIRCDIAPNFLDWSDKLGVARVVTSYTILRDPQVRPVDTRFEVRSGSPESMMDLGTQS